MAKKSDKPRNPWEFRDRSLYRAVMGAAGLTRSVVRVKETDLLILADRDVTEEARAAVLEGRASLEDYIKEHPEFLASLVPLPRDPLAPPLAKAMFDAASTVGVGPMAAVAGAIAEFVGLALVSQGVEEVVVENGGDLFIHMRENPVVRVFAGSSPLSNKVGVRLPQGVRPLGVCTSSGTVGHSLSLGRADAVTVVAGSAPLADAAATRLGNEIKGAGDIAASLALLRGVQGILGAVCIVGDRIGAWGEIELEPLSSR